MLSSSNRRHPFNQKRQFAINVTPSVELPSCSAKPTHGHIVTRPESAWSSKPPVKALLPETDGHVPPLVVKIALSAHGVLVSFGATETDFYIIIPVSDLNDNEVLATLWCNSSPL